MGPTEQKATIYYIKCRYIRKRKLVQFVQYSCKDQKAYNKKMNGNKSGERAHKRAEDDANAIAIVIVKYIQQSAGQKNEKKKRNQKEKEGTHLQLSHRLTFFIPATNLILHIFEIL